MQSEGGIIGRFHFCAIAFAGHSLKDEAFCMQFFHFEFEDVSPKSSRVHAHQPNLGHLAILRFSEVNLLAAQGEYAVRQNAELFREFVGRDSHLPTILRGPSYHKDAK